MASRASYEAHVWLTPGEIILMRTLAMDGASNIPTRWIAVHLTKSRRTLMIGAVYYPPTVERFVVQWTGSTGPGTEGTHTDSGKHRRPGGGGMARAAVFAILREGGLPVIFNRNPERGATLARDFHCQVRTLDALEEFRADVLINTTPVGMYPQTEASPVAAALLPRFRLVMDAVYNPRETRLLREAAAAGCTVADGVGLLVRQGAEQIRIWTGREAPTAVMRRAVLTALQVR